MTIAEDIAAIKKVAAMVAKTQPIWSGQLQRVAEAASPTPEHGDAIKAIREHNESCESSCKAQRPGPCTVGCGYQLVNGYLRYPPRRCPNCPMDWRIELPLPDATVGPAK